MILLFLPSYSCIIFAVFSLQFNTTIIDICVICLSEWMVSENILRFTRRKKGEKKKALKKPNICTLKYVYYHGTSSPILLTSLQGRTIAILGCWRYLAASGFVLKSSALPSFFDRSANLLTNLCRSLYKGTRCVLHCFWFYHKSGT